MKFQLFSVLVSLLVSGPVQIHGQCPDASEAVNELNTCLSEFHDLMNFRNGPITATQLNAYCSSSARPSEINCAENIISDCEQTSPTVSRIIDKAVNINGIRSSVKIVCNNTEIFAEKEDCIERYNVTVTTCIANEHWIYNAKLQSLKAQASSKGVEWYVDKVYEELCDFVGEVSVCQRPYGINCGREVGDVFDALTHASKPPVCVAVMEHVNLVLLISLAFVAVVKENF